MKLIKGLSPEGILYLEARKKKNKQGKKKTHKNAIQQNGKQAR